MPKKRIVFYVPEDLHKLYKSKLAAEGKEMSEELREYVRQYVEGEA